MTGPKRAPTAPVPKRWIAKRASRTTTVIGTTQSSRLGVATPRPSTAESTEMAGVIMPSP